MTGYQPPLHEITFALREWAGLPELAAGAPDHETVTAVLNEAGRFASEVLAPIDIVGHREGCDLRADGSVRTPSGWADAYRKFVAAGWNTVHFPTELGGQGLPVPVSVAVAEVFQGANVAFSLALMPFAGVVTLLERFGTPEQKNRYIPHLVSGRWSATLAITENHAGTDIGAIRTLAIDTADGLLLKGQKCFISYGAHDLNENILHFVLARDPAGRSGVKGVSLFIVPKRRVLADGTLGPLNDVRCLAVEKKMGIHGSPTTTLQFGEKGGAWGERLGEACKGVESMFVVLNRARLNIGVFGLASAERASQAARSYANERVQGVDPSGQPCVIARHPDVRRMLCEMQADVDASRAVSYYAAGVLDRSLRGPDADEREHWRRRLDLLTPIVKGWVTETAYACAGTGVQVAGGIGYMDESPASRCLRDARVHTIYEGTTGIQSLDLAFRKVAKDRGRIATELVAEMRATSTQALESALLGRESEAITAAYDALDGATHWIVERAVTAPDQVQAVCFHYLEMWGTCLAGWLLLLAAGVDPSRRHRALIFLRHRLPRVAMHADILAKGAESLLHEDALSS